MRKMGLGHNYIVAILDDRESIHQSNKEYADKFKELTEYFTIFKYFGEILYGKSINEILEKALQTDNKYCIIQCVGHFIKEKNFFDLVENWTSKKDFFITGHIMDKHTKNSAHPEGNGYYGLHKQCLLVNLHYYKKFNKPEYGKKNSGEYELRIPKRAKQDIHDDYTPIGLMGSEETQVCTPIVDGWNFINKSIENNLTVYNFHPKLRDSKQYTYPNKNLDELQTQLSWINQILVYAPQCVFFWNTEKYYDIKNTELEIDRIDYLYSVAASFKPNFILNKYGFTDKTEIVFFDYSKQALAFKKLLLEQWDGENYPKFLYDIKKKYPQINETTHNPYGDDDYNKLWEIEIENWQSTENIKEHWDRYKKLKHSFIYCDVCKNPDKVTKLIRPKANSVIWWSNVFHTVNAHYVRRLSELKDIYENNWIQKIKNQNPDIWIFGKDYLNNPVEGTTILKYKE